VTAITIQEFARRICHEHHPFYPGGTPCGAHITEAARLWGLVQPSGTKTLRVIRTVRLETGVELDALEAPIRD